MKVGLISDTHGYFNPVIREIFQDVELILHAGDIGSEEIIRELEKIAPIKAVYGNTDYYPLTHYFTADEHVTVFGKQIWLTHYFNEYRSRDRRRFSKITRPDFIIHGHTHSHEMREFEKVQIINPGTAAKGGRHESPYVAIIEIFPNSTPSKVEFVCLR